MNVNCAGGTDWSRNVESSCSVENKTVAVCESEESNVALGGHSPAAVPWTEGKDNVFIVIFKGDFFEGCYVLEKFQYPKAVRTGEYVRCLSQAGLKHNGPQQSLEFCCLHKTITWVCPGWPTCCFS